MIPITSSVRIRSARHQFWIPLFLVWLLLLPVALLLLPFFAIGCLIIRVNPFRALSTLFGIVTSLRGTDIAVEDSYHSVQVHIP